MPNHPSRRNRITEKKRDGAAKRTHELDIQARKYERHILHFVKSRTDPPLGGLDRSRVAALEDALRTPVPLPTSPEDIAADKERRRAAMAEVNEAIDKLPAEYAQRIATLRAGRPKIGVRQTGYSIPSLPAEPSVDKTRLTHKRMSYKGDQTYSTMMASEEMEQIKAYNKLIGPQFGEYVTLSKEGYEDLGLKRRIQRLRREFEEKGWDTGDEEDEKEKEKEKTGEVEAMVQGDGWEDWGSEVEREMEEALRE